MFENSKTNYDSLKLLRREFQASNEDRKERYFDQN